MYYEEVYYNTPPPGKKVLIQLQIFQAAEDGGEGDDWEPEQTADQAMADEEEGEAAEDGRVELAEEKVQLEGEVVEDAHDEVAAGLEYQPRGRPVCSGRRTQCQSCRPSGW